MYHWLYDGESTFLEVFFITHELPNGQTDTFILEVTISSYARAMANGGQTIVVILWDFIGLIWK